MITKRSQSSMEFMILIGFLLFGFTILFAFIYENISDRGIENNNKQVLEVATTVKEEIDLAYQSSEGYYRIFEIPENINNLDYEINITENIIYIKTINGKHSASFSIRNINQSNSSNLVKGKNVIEKINGEVVINRNG